MADLAFLEAKIVCGGAWGNDKMVWGFIGVGIFGEHSEQLGALGFFLVGIWGATRSTRIFWGGDFGSTRSVGGVWAFGKGRCLNKEGILRL